MICAGTSDNPMNCGDEAITIISGFSVCRKHANEMAMVFRMLKKQMIAAKKKMKSPYEATSIYSNDIESQSLKGLDDLRQGKFKNVKHKF